MSAQPQVILASGSKIRAALLENAGIRFSVVRPDVDEGVIKDAGKAHGDSVAKVATDLAKAKALKVVADAPSALVIAADQILACDGEWYDKPRDMADARARLMELRGRRHELVTAVVVMMGERELLAHVSTAGLIVRRFSDAFLDRYLADAGEKVCESVGAYQLEGLGAQLFDAIQGDFFTILGLPLLPVLDVLRRQEILVE